ncbi:MAG: RlpA-like double-psi beta-barrel domain-containing protein [Candidatus Malihini olakiniferum]
MRSQRHYRCSPYALFAQQVHVINLSNGRCLLMRVNDHGPYTPGRIINLSKTAGDRLNVSSNTKVKFKAIAIALDGSLFELGTIPLR